MSHSRTLALSLALALAALALPLPAQPPQEAPAREEPFAEELVVTEVLLDVLVTDRDGNVIVGLGPGDFVVEEGGEPVELTSVVFYSNRPLLEPAAAAATAEGGEVDTAPRNRYFLLLFEEQQRRSASELDLIRRQLEAGRDVERWIEGDLLRDDFVAVLGYGVKLKVHQDFTRDREKLTRAVSNAITGEDPGANWPSRIEPEGGASLRAHLPQGRALEEQTETIYDALQVVAEAAGHFLGRKNLLLFSTGFGRISSFGQYEPDPRYFPPMIRALNDNNVAIYSIDLTPPGVDQVMAGGLNQLADESGGEYLFNFTRFTTPLKKISDTTSGYYLLSYRSSHPRGSSGYQKVKVRAANPEFSVRARDGYLYGE